MVVVERKLRWRFQSVNGFQVERILRVQQITVQDDESLLWKKQFKKRNYDLSVKWTANILKRSASYFKKLRC